ncbi:MAG: hypothetical protein JW955_07245 [Sedimentisphaerales bacterium]|nr:hypothetical protein [Sedimentisphaerales bacterium]
MPANTLFSLFYYMRIARAMYFNRSNLIPVRVPGFTAVLLTICAAGLLVLFLGWGLLNNLSLSLFGLAN